MRQNRNKLMQLLVGNLVNIVVHKVLEATITENILRERYQREGLVSFEVAKRYREKINPADRELPEKDFEQIKEVVSKRARQELLLRISKGYAEIDLSLIDKVLDEILKELVIKE